MEKSAMKLPSAISLWMMTIGPVLGVTLRFLLFFEGVEGVEGTPRPLPIRVRPSARLADGCDAPTSSCVSCAWCVPLGTAGEREDAAVAEEEGAEEDDDTG